MVLPDSLTDVDAILTGVAADLGVEVVRRQALGDDEVQTVVEAIGADVLPAEVEEFLRLDGVIPWPDSRPIVPDLLGEKGIYEADEFGAAHWLPIGEHQRDHWSAVLGPFPFARAPLVVWSSTALVIAAPFPSLRTCLLGYAEALRVIADLDGEDLRRVRSDWWQAALDQPRFTDDLAPHWKHLERPLRELISAEDESPIWPRGVPPMPFTDQIDRAAWPEHWRRALRVEVYRRPVR